MPGHRPCRRRLRRSGYRQLERVGTIAAVSALEASALHLACFAPGSPTPQILEPLKLRDLAKRHIDRVKPKSDPSSVRKHAELLRQRKPAVAAAREVDCGDDGFERDLAVAMGE